jgi:hypothetical protein
MSKKQLTELNNLKAFEVSLVDKGANLKKRFPITKQQEIQMNEEILKAVLETEVDEEASLVEKLEKAKVSEKGIEAAKAALRLFSSFKDEVSSDVFKAVGKANGFPMEEEDEDEKKKKAEAEAEAKAKKEKELTMSKEVKKGLDMTPEVQAHFEAVQKAQDAKFEAQQAQLEAVQKALDAEKDERRMQEWVSKAKDELSFVPNKTPEELAVTFKKLEDTDPKLADEHFTQLKEVAALVEKSDLLKEVGGRGLAVGSAYDKIMKNAKAYGKEKNLTEEQAFDEYIQTDEGSLLYDEYESN